VPASIPDSPAGWLRANETFCQEKKKLPCWKRAGSEASEGEEEKTVPSGGNAISQVILTGCAGAAVPGMPAPRTGGPNHTWGLGTSSLSGMTNSARSSVKPKPAERPCRGAFHSQHPEPHTHSPHSSAGKCECRCGGAPLPGAVGRLAGPGGMRCLTGAVPGCSKQPRKTSRRKTKVPR
jgi:hypothetical protein